MEEVFSGGFWLEPCRPKRWFPLRHPRHCVLRRRGAGCLCFDSLPLAPSFLDLPARPSRCPGARSCPGKYKTFHCCTRFGASSLMAHPTFPVYRYMWCHSPIDPSSRRGTAIETAAVVPFPPSDLVPDGAASHLSHRPLNGVHFQGITAFLISLATCCSRRRVGGCTQYHAWP